MYNGFIPHFVRFRKFDKVTCTSMNFEKMCGALLDVIQSRDDLWNHGFFFYFQTLRKKLISKVTKFFFFFLVQKCFFFFSPNILGAILFSKCCCTSKRIVLWAFNFVLFSNCIQCTFFFIIIIFKFYLINIGRYRWFKDN